MKTCGFSLLLLLAGCGAPQPASLRGVAAYELTLNTEADRQRFVAILRQAARPYGFHVDAADHATTEQLSTVSPITVNVAVWKDGSDSEPIASAMDGPDHLHRPWLSFALGSDIQRSTAFRKRATALLLSEWPEMLSLPIMPSGAIPLPGDMERTKGGYRVKPEEAAKYNGTDGQAAAVRQKGR